MKQVSEESRTERERLRALILAAQDVMPVSGLTHNFYRYPARFSPSFVRAAILTFSKPGDWILDPFVGGGTTLVEAMAHGRNAIGIDISDLATFICEAKTLILDEGDVKALRLWGRRLPATINMHARSRRFRDYADAGYYRNLEGREYWRIRKAIEQVLSSIVRLRSERAKTLARCILLKTAQWALDARKTLPTVAQFRDDITAETESMLKGAMELRTRVNSGPSGRRPRAICLHRPAAGLESESAIARAGPPSLVLTSPPYPGIHVLYHRWQVDGRREAPAPFWIANRLDGAGASYYTMGDRKYPQLQTYFEQLESSFESVAKICGPDTTVVQMVAFSDPEWQLPRYLEIMRACGLRECRPWDFDGLDRHGRLWREVPNRKWHAHQKEFAPGSREVVLIHRVAKR